MTKIALQLYSVRDIDADLASILELVADTGYDGVEFAHRIHDADLDAVEQTLSKTGLEVVGAHAGLTQLQDDPDGISKYESIGCNRLVIPHIPADEFDDALTIDALADYLSELAETLDERGMTLGYHNQDHEFRRLNGETAFERLVRKTDDRVVFEFDVGGAVAAGVSPDSVFDTLAGRVPLVHMKDVTVETPIPGTGQQSVLAGDGDVDFAAVVATAQEYDVEWLVYEHDHPADPREALRVGAEALRPLVDSSP